MSQDEAMQLRFKIETDRGLGMFGYLDFVLSIRRNWRGDANWNAGPTWRHITICLRSPVVFYAKRTGLSSPRWFRLRFGYGSGNVYLGFVYIVTTFGRQGVKMAYRKYGPLEWAIPAKAVSMMQPPSQA